MANEPGELIGIEARQLIDEWMGDGRLVNFEVGERKSLERYVSQMQQLGLFKIYDFDAEPSIADPGSVFCM